MNWNEVISLFTDQGKDVIVCVYCCEDHKVSSVFVLYFDIIRNGTL